MGSLISNISRQKGLVFCSETKSCVMRVSALAAVALLYVSSKSKQLSWYFKAQSAVLICIDFVILCSSHEEQLCTKYILMSVQLLAVFLVVFSNIFYH